MSSGKTIPIHNLTFEKFQVMTLENGHPENFHDIHRHNFFEIIWFQETQRNSLLELDFKEYSIQDNHICIIAPGQVFNMKLRGEKGFVFAISREVFQEVSEIEMILESGTQPFFLDSKSSETCQIITELIRQEYQENSRINLIKAYLRAFCIIIAELLTTSDDIGNDKLRIQQLITLIEKHYTTQKDTTFYAEKLSVSNHHLNDIVRVLRGTTVKKMIGQRLLLEAKRELSFGVLTVKEVAFKLGFNDASYFSRFFKKHTGYNPEQFKNFSISDSK